MLTLNQNLLNGIRRGTVKLAALVGMVVDFLNDEQSTESDWNSGIQVGTPGVDFPATTFAANLTAGGTTATVTSTSGFTVGSVTNPGFLIFSDGVNAEIVSYTGSNGTQFTDLNRGLYGTTGIAWSIGEFVLQLIFSHGESPDFDLELQQKNWIQPAAVAGPPAPRKGARMVYRATDNACYMFGGFNGTVYLNDLWKLDLATNTWSNITPGAGNPGIRAYHAMIYHARLDEIWVAGGFNGAALRDVHKYNFGGAAWSTSAGWNMPAHKYNAMAAYYEVTSTIVRMFVAGGQFAGGAFSNTTHNFNGGAWTTLLSTGFLWALGDACWDRAAGDIIVVGWSSGLKSGRFDVSTGSWFHAPQIADPPAWLFYTTLVFDDVNRRALMFGGEPNPPPGAGTQALYSYYPVTNQWSTLNAYTRENRTRHTAAWNSTDKEMVVWGGSINSVAPTFPTFVEPMRFRYYWAEGTFRTQTMDMGVTPAEEGNWELEDVTDVINLLTAVGYSAEWSNDDIAWNPIGTVFDGDEITELHRYYRVTAVLTNLGFNQTPKVQRIDANFDEIKWFSMISEEKDIWSTIADFPPIVKRISSLRSSLDILKSKATMGTINFDLINTSKIAEKLVTDFFPRNNTVYVKIGLAENDFPITDFVLVFKGRVDDWTSTKDTISFSTIDFLGDLKKEIPEEDGVGAITSIVYNNVSGIAHPIDIIEDILRNQINIPDRDIDLVSIDVAAADPSLSGWAFNRVLFTPEDAYELIREISQHSAALLIPRENGKIALQILDPSDEPVGTWDEKLYNFKNVKFNAQGKTIRNFISTWWGWNGGGDEFANYMGAEISIDATSVTNWGRKVKRLKSHWLGNASAPYEGDDRAQDISDRILALAENGIPTVDLETNIATFPFQVGDLIRVRASVVQSLNEYIFWASQFNVSRDLNFIEESGRYSLEYLVFGVAESIDHKWWITSKNVDFNRGVIRWTLSRAREAPLVETFTTQDDFLQGFGQDIDLDATPGSVVIALNGAVYFAVGIYELIIDMDQQPEQNGVWSLSDTEPSDSSVTYEAWASETGHFQGEQMPIGAVVHNDPITLKTRWYMIKCTLNASTDLLSTPQVNIITITFSEG